MSVQRLRLVLLVALLGCVQLASEFDRVATRDAAIDRGASADQPAPPRDVGSLMDSARVDDLPMIDLDRPAGVDVIRVVDAGGVEPDTGPTGPLRLREQGFSSGGVVATGSSNLRLLEWGFEQGQTTCMGSLCVTGGVMP